MVVNIYSLETQKDIDHMLKNEFLDKIEVLFDKKELKFDKFLMIFKTLFANFKEDLNYNVDETIGININNAENHLFIDLWNDSINIRCNNNEFYFFVKEISLEEFKKIIVNFFKGEYVLKIYVNGSLIVKQELIFNETELKKYNKTDIYSSKKWHTSIIEKKGYDWFNN